jgi:hypothetical protein
MAIGELSNAGSDVALNTLFRTDTMYLGLATSTIDDTTTLATVVEEDDTNYERKTIAFHEPADVGGKQTIKNNGAVAFDAWASGASDAITWAFITTVATLAEGNIIAYFALPTAKQPAAGETLTIPDEGCTFDID